MHAPRCKVSFTDSDGIVHEVQVYADSVYEAIGQAIQQFRTGSLTPADPNASTEFLVEVHRQPVTHRLRFKQVTTWAEGGGRSPQDTLARNRIRKLLEAKERR